MCVVAVVGSTYIHKLLLWFAFQIRFLIRARPRLLPHSPSSRRLHHYWPTMPKRNSKGVFRSQKLPLHFRYFFVISFLIRLLATLQPFCVCFCVVFDSDSCCFYYLDIFLLKIDISTTTSSLKLRVFAGRICSFLFPFDLIPRRRGMFFNSFTLKSV